MDQEVVFRDVVEHVKENGPSLPLELSPIIGKDSFITNAMLSEMLSKQKLKRTDKTFGNSPIYYIEGQEEAATNRLFEVLKPNEKKLVEKFQRDKVIFEDELEPPERFILSGLTDYIVPYNIQIQEQKLTCYRIFNLKDDFFKQMLDEKLENRYPKPKEEPKAEVAEETSPQEEAAVQTKINVPKVEDKKHTVIETKPKSPIIIEKKEKQDTLHTNVEINGELEQKAANVVAGLQGEILDKVIVKKNTEIDFKSKISGLIYIVKAKKKASLSEADLSLMYTQVMDEKKPMILVTSAKISKKAKTFKEKKIGDLIRILNI